MIYAACGYQLADGAKGRESAGGQWDSNGLVFGGLVGNTEGKRVLGSGTAMDWCLVGWWETLRERECFEDLVIDGRMILKCIVRKYSKTCLKRTPYISETWTNGK